MTRTTPTRRGFTLIEILVAIALGIVLLSIAVGVSQSSAFESYKVVGAADRVSQWMLTAKNRALRDKAPRGIRFLIDPNTGRSTEIAYIEQPDPWVPTANRTINAESPRLIVQRIVSQSPPAGAGAGTAERTRVFLINVPNPTGIISQGDTLYLPEVGQSYALTSNPVVNPTDATGEINPAPVASATPTPWPPPPTTPPAVNWTIGNPVVELVLANVDDLGRRFGSGYAQTQPGPPFSVAATYHTTNFAVFRRPRPLLGEPTQLLTSGMAVDFDATPRAHPVFRPTLPGPPPTPGPFPTEFDVLFAPSGEVIGATDSLLAFVLRDPALRATTSQLNLTLQADVNGAGQMILVCLYTRTGAISTQPVNPPTGATPAADPFQFAKDGVNTGL